MFPQLLIPECRYRTRSCTTRRFSVTKKGGPTRTSRWPPTIPEVHHAEHCQAENWSHPCRQLSDFLRFCRPHNRV